MAITNVLSDLEFADDFEVREEAIKDILQQLHEAPVDLREALQRFRFEADVDQLEVIASEASSIRVIAAAGSGKTVTMVQRMLHRVKQGLNPSRILFLTFDNSAAESIREKLQQSVQALGINVDVFVSTLNAFGWRILREHVPEEFQQIALPYLRKSMIRSIRKHLDENAPERNKLLSPRLHDRVFLDLISLLKNDLFDPRISQPSQIIECFAGARSPVILGFLNPTVDPNPQAISKLIVVLDWFFRAYDLKLRERRVMDFDDQKLRAYLAMRDDESLRNSIQQQFSEVIVDEFQDQNKLDCHFVKTIAEKATLIICGDDDQAIYQWRGAVPEYLIDPDKYLDRKFLSLELKTNYRNPKNLLAHASKLIRCNSYRVEKFPHAGNEAEAEIHIVKSRTAGIEAKVIVESFKTLKSKNPRLKFSDMAVLYRTNAQSLPIQVELVLNEVPYYVRESDNILKNDSLGKILAILKVKLAHSNREDTDPQDASTAICAYYQYVPNDIPEKLHRYFVNGEFGENLASPKLDQIFPKIAKSAIRQAFSELFSERSLVRSLELIGDRFNGVGGMIGTLDDMINELVPLGEIYELAANCRNSTSRFVSIVEEALTKARERNAGNDQENGVALLTYFKAKGLQWHTVVLSSANDGIIPHKRSPIDEERRLFYVGLTRASSNLIISYLEKSCRNKVGVSRFLKEADLM